MNLDRDTFPWEYDDRQTYIPIYDDGELVGFCSPDRAQQIVDAMNEEKQACKALRLACSDILRRAGKNPNRADVLAKKYLEKAERPKQGPLAVAALLEERKIALKFGDEEFVSFCDTYKLSPESLRAIYDGENIEEGWLWPLSRILGTTREEVVAVLNGYLPSC